MHWIKAFHVMAMVAWFSGIFYLPRLFVYHTEAEDAVSNARFKIMERRLYYGITTPAAIITTLLGFILLSYQLQFYMSQGWMHFKLGLIGILWGYHILCGKFLKQFANDANQKSSKFYRIFNELPVFLLAGIVIAVIVKPF